jgi:ketosteroid isomerase-like protein
LNAAGLTLAGAEPYARVISIRGTTMDAAATAHAVFDALDADDFDRFRSFFATDAVIWHNYDGAEIGLEETALRLKKLRAMMKDARYVERRYVSIADGAVCQHTLRMNTLDGQPIELHAMLRMFLRDGLVRRVEEYFDPAQVNRHLKVTGEMR